MKAHRDYENMPLVAPQEFEGSHTKGTQQEEKNISHTGNNFKIYEGTHFSPIPLGIQTQTSNPQINTKVSGVTSVVKTYIDTGIGICHE